ncbi:MAG: DUF2141 domain-containing protein [Bacteroidia bacterium]|nr:DUF2141 domain-containing protein [Bacteroidia bacterium]MBT8275410.1 DUF2141 domain-containing protein [Bacteroidia bacterium]NNF30884.1 DUF2141 domain-containing protein [Flavobacteriaceae bacterium]NNK54497.1 DUF2141 domain-containing protein [Flavobacteriaceae bacterium]NNM08031.1 DUF2141 domain-containing protein [Flavobacteriaceae bacterium]
MQTLLLYIMLLLTGMLVHAQNTVEVSLRDFNHNKGHVRVGLYNDADQFLDKTFKSKRTEIKGKAAKVTFTDLPDGIYAISCYHDEDDNGELNMFLGMIPSEPYGTSNNARGFFGPPKWEDARFELRDGEVRKLDINM